MELTSGDKISVPVDILLRKYYHAYKNDTLIINVVSIQRYIDGTETKDLLLEQGFSSFFEFYRYLFKVKSEELDFEHYIEDKNSFLRQHLKNVNLIYQKMI